VKRSFRLTRSTDFQRVRQAGKSYAHPLVVLIALPAPDQVEHSRFGVAAGRSVGNAVHRNRAKRLLRNALQSYLPMIVPGWDVVVIARRPMAEATCQQTQAVLFGLLKRARILQDNYDILNQ
jgi:ribonuclease P protein component